MNARPTVRWLTQRLHVTAGLALLALAPAFATESPGPAGAEVLAYVAAPPSDGLLPVLPDAPVLDPPVGDEPVAAAPEPTSPVWDSPDAQLPAMPLPGGTLAESPPARRALIDRMQTGVYRGVDATGRWVDGWFARGDAAPPTEPTMGRLGSGVFWDQRDGADPNFRLRARIPFNNARNRFGLLLGRGPDRELIENRTRAGTNSLPNGFQSIEDEAWLVGLGFSPDGVIGQGFNFDVGVRIRLDPELFARGAYRWNIELSDRTLLRPTQTVFWRRSRGFGETTDLTLDHLIGRRFMLRTAVSGTVAEDTDGLEWQSYVTLFQDLRGRNTLAWTALAAGETNAPVALQNYGLQLRYRRRILRDWLFAEFLQGVTFPRELPGERREANFGVGVGFEMYFGPVPADQLR